MDTNVKRSLWQQFTAALDTLEDALRLCPDELWETKLWEDEDDPRYGTFWYIAGHTLIWTDFFISRLWLANEEFVPLEPFLRGRLPDVAYQKRDVEHYLKVCREKFKNMIVNLTDAEAHKTCEFSWMKPTYLELQLYSMRHIQEHAAQLNMILGHRGITGQDWFAKGKEDLPEL